MNEDIEYFEECLNANFFVYKNVILLSDLTNLPSDEELQSKKTAEIEKKYNHFHMSFITSDLEKQKSYALKIWEAWRELFQKTFPNEEIEIQITDDGSEITIWLHRITQKKPA